MVAASDVSTFDIAQTSGTVSARLYHAPIDRRLGATYVFGHGAGAGHDSPFIVRFARALAARGVDTVTFNFPYTEARRRVPDRNDVLEDCCVRAMAATAARPDLAGNRLFAGGKSMGGRIASHVAARDPGPVAGLVFLGYPLHPPGRPDRLRSAHLPGIAVPMLFVQGSRDAFGTPDELRAILAGLSAETRLLVVEGGDHSLAVPRGARPAQEDVYEMVLDEMAGWMARPA